MINSTASLDAATVSRCRAPASIRIDEPSGIMPSEGNPERICACSGVRTVLSMLSRRNARKTPEAMPRASAKARPLGLVNAITATKGNIVPVTLGIFTYLGSHISNWSAVMATASSEPVT